MPQRPKQVVSNKEIGQRLKLLRQERGLTQTEFAELVGLSQPNVSAIERGARGATLHQVIRFALALGASTDAILLAAQAPTAAVRASRRLVQRLHRIEELSPADQRVVLQLVEGLLLRRQQRPRKVPA